jgi:hypothetical protein
MYYTSGFDECLNNLVVLANSHADRPVQTGADLAAAVRAFAMATSPRPAPPGPVRLVEDQARLRVLVRQFDREPAGGHRHPLAAPAQSVGLFWDAVEMLPAPAQWLFRLLVTEVALYDGDVVTPGSGALLEQLGTVYVAPGPRWAAEDIAECLVHELTHLLLRCDEHRFGHFVDPADAGRRQEFGATAVTRSLRSPLVVFHSLVVAAEIVGLRRQLGADREGVHGPEELLMERALECAREVLGRPDRDRHFTARAVLLMERADTTLRAALQTRTGRACV